MFPEILSRKFVLLKCAVRLINGQQGALVHKVSLFNLHPAHTPPGNTTSQ
jgi:hypothetical protein